MEKTLVVKGHRVHWYVHGPSPTPGSIPLVLLHGFCENAEVWAPVLQEMKKNPNDLAQRTTIVLDLPGFGASEVPRTSGMNVYADVLCAVLNELNVNGAAVAGHSMGGYTALAFAAQYSERLAGLSLVHSQPFADSEERKANRRRGIELLQSGKKEAYVSQLVPGLFPESFREQHPEVVQKQLDQARRQSAEGIVQALQGMMDRHDHSALLTELAVPVQFVLGALDTITPPGDLLPLLAKPAVSDVQWIEDCGHMGLLEQPGRVAAALLHFHELCTQMAPAHKK